MPHRSAWRNSRARATFEASVVDAGAKSRWIKQLDLAFEEAAAAQ